LVAGLLLSVSSGAASAHALQCWTADPGTGTFTIYCGPQQHDLPDQWGRYGIDGYGFAMTVGVTQSAYGSFDWDELRLTNGYDNTPGADFGILFIEDFVNMNAPVYASETWRCQAVGATTYSAITAWPLWHTASRQGAWEMRSETGGDCLNPTMMNHDYTVVNAY